MGKLLIALKKAKAIISSVKLTQEPLVDGTLIQYDTDSIELNEPVYLCDGASDWSLLPDGKYKTKNGVEFVITDGVVAGVDSSASITPATTAGPIPQGIDNSSQKPDEVTLDIAAMAKPTLETPVTPEPVLASSLINPPGAGAPPTLVDPDKISADDSYSTCMRALNELQTQHAVLQNTHSQLRQEHDSTNAKLNELIKAHNNLATKFDDMAMAKEKMSKAISVLEKQPAAAPIEEHKGNHAVPKDIELSRAFQILNSK